MECPVSRLDWDAIHSFIGDVVPVFKQPDARIVGAFLDGDAPRRRP